MVCYQDIFQQLSIRGVVLWSRGRLFLILSCPWFLLVYRYVSLCRAALHEDILVV